MSANRMPVSPMKALLPAIGVAAHEVQFYAEDRPLVEEISRLIASSLVNGDSAVVIATRAHRDALARALLARDVNLPRIIAQGRYLAWDAAETLSRFMAGGMPDAERFSSLASGAISEAKSAARADAHVLIFGEMVALLWSQGNREAAVRLEELWNDLAERHAFSLRCAYPIHGFHGGADAEFFDRICGAHSAVLPPQSRALVFSDDERLQAVAGAQPERTQKKSLFASEQHFRLLVEAVQDYAIFMLDSDGHVASWNLGAERIKGYRAAEIIGQHFSRFYPRQDVLAGKPEWELEVAARDGRLEDEGWRVRKDGSRFWANVIITALKDPEGKLIGFAKVTRDFTERIQTQRRLEESQRLLQESEKSLRELSLHLLRTQDEERRRIGRDLHDSLGQYLSVLKMKLDSLRSADAGTTADDRRELAQCSGLAEEAVKEVRTIAYLLYPPMLEEMGLKFAIPWYLDGFTKRSGIETTLEVPPDFGRLAADVELVFFRVLQESLTNVHRHSGSRTARVRLSANDDAVTLEISDRGKGMQLRNLEDAGPDWMGSLGVGLRGMSERVRQTGGKLELTSGEEGTIVTAVVPISKARVDAAPS